ncbi:MAG: nitrite reductase large subunit [Solirubrobacteraceae bacterium]|nr:nitrite reductase large subunit [Solirubrobacteraceae bacterium]
MNAAAFPNYTQIRSRLPQRAWQAMRVASITGAVVLASVMIADEHDGLFVFWKLLVPVLPLLFLVAPGVWRNLCPLAASNQTPRQLGMSNAATAPKWLKEYGYVIGVTGFVGFVIGRKFGLDDSGPASALLLFGAMASAFAGGMLLKGKSGWCSTICPLLPVQRLYGQTPVALVANNHCQPCVGCAANCYDFNPRVAYLADLEEPDPHWSGHRKLFAGAFPGLILAFFNVDERLPAGEKLGHIGLYIAATVTAFFVLETLLRVSAHKITTLFAAAAFSIFYWYAGPNFAGAVSDSTVPDAATWIIRAAAVGLALTFLVRTYRKEAVFREPETTQLDTGGSLSMAGTRSLAARRTSIRGGGPEVEFKNTGKRVVPKPGQTLLDLAEAQQLPIEAGCRMGVCGADPVAIVSGMEHLAKVTDDERNTLERLGLAPNTRMACCARVKDGPVSVSLTPEAPEQPTTSQIRGFKFDRSIQRVVIVGNGIAGVTAADHVRRRHPLCEIHLVSDEPHPLYNRMGIARLIYGRSAMNGLYLNPEKWYAERSITEWLNTQAAALDIDGRAVVLATGERLPYDRLILATGSAAAVPAIEGFGAPGTFVLRNAADALELRGFAQRVGARRAAVAGGGLLGLEAAFALSKFGLRAAVLQRGDRLLGRQLDDVASGILQAYLEGLGIEILTGTETASVTANGRVTGVRLRDGRRLDTDLLLVAAGITPNVAIARDAGLDVDAGVVVDDRMASSHRHVYAAGDVAEHRRRILGLWPAAVEQAEVAADNAVGGTKTYHGTVPVTALKVAGIDLTSAGRFEAADGDEAIAQISGDGQRYRKLVVDREGRVAGAILIGYPAESAGVIAAVRAQATVDSRAVRAGNWSALAAAD